MHYFNGRLTGNNLITVRLSKMAIEIGSEQSKTLNNGGWEKNTIMGRLEKTINSLAKLIMSKTQRKPRTLKIDKPL